MDIMDYIRPASCSDEAFRAMWAEFEWENKVAINTTFLDLQAFLTHVVSSTNMECLTPTSSLSGESAFLAANLYAKSVFGEDALVNLSVEKKDDADGRLSGYVRIRSKTQGIALSLGDRITAIQRVGDVQEEIAA
jgi:coatomer subunit beta